MTSVFFERVDNYIIREATPDDFQSVLNIADNVYDGEDYLRAMYYLYLQSKNYKILVGDQDGELFSLMMADFGFDESNPTVFTSMAHRISKSKQGRGIFRQFEAACHRLLRSQFPQLSRWLSVTDEKYLKPGGYTPLYRMNQLRCRMTRSSLHQSIGAFTQSLKTTTTIQGLNYQQAVELLNNGQLLENFFSRYCTEYLVALTGNYDPVRINSKKSLKMAFAFSSSVFITADGTVLKGDNDKTSDPDQPHGNITSLSFAHALPVKFGQMYKISFYGDDPYIAALHEVEHCRHLAAIANVDNVVVKLLLPYELDSEKFTDVVNPVFGLHEYINDGPFVLAELPIICTRSD